MLDFFVAQGQGANQGLGSGPVNLYTSDESIFHLSGKVNRQNTRYWAHKNPHCGHEFTANSPKVVVWAAVLRSRIVGTFFFTENVNGANYLAMLCDFFIPAVRGAGDARSICFQQECCQ
jgi:hypothetical protein